MTFTEYRQELDVLRLGQGYSVEDPYTVKGLREIVNIATRRLSSVDFDTIVGTGMSGGLIIPTLAWKMNKHFTIIRKSGANGHSASHVGELGNRWIFVDDFVATGETKNRVIDEVDRLAAKGRYGQSFCTEYVGKYLYNDPRLVRAQYPHRTCSGDW